MHLWQCSWKSYRNHMSQLKTIWIIGNERYYAICSDLITTYPYHCLFSFTSLLVWHIDSGNWFFKGRLTHSPSQSWSDGGRLQSQNFCREICFYLFASTLCLHLHPLLLSTKSLPLSMLAFKFNSIIKLLIPLLNLGTLHLDKSSNIATWYAKVV